MAMQPQEAGFDWWHPVSGALGAIIGAASTLLPWIIGAARTKTKIAAYLAASEKALGEKIDAVERRNDMTIETEIGHFRETLVALRQQINDADRNSVSRVDFANFRTEYHEDHRTLREETREDMARLQHNIAEMIKAAHGQ